MGLSVKNKIWMGTVFLCLLLFLAGGAGIYSTITLKNGAKAVLQDNYESVSYCHTIQQQLDSSHYDFLPAVKKIDYVLGLQEKNITEPGEKEATSKLRLDFEALKAGDTSMRQILILQGDLQRVLSLNMNAIQNKNEKARAAAENAMTIIVLLTGAVFLIAFSFSINFPSIVTNPIKHFKVAIKEITNKNYKHRIVIDNKDEFGELADAFNKMAERLEYFESSNLNKIMFEKGRAEAVINSLQDASIGIDKDNKVLFANSKALMLLGLKSNDILDQTVEAVENRNDLFRFLLNSESSAPFKIVIENRENYFIKEVIDVPLGENKNKVIVLKNITSYKELDVAKTNFIATISHELKTPLAASDFSLKLLEDERIGTLSPEQKELIQNLKQDNQRLLKILSELLNMSQVEAGKIELDVQVVNPYLIIDHAIETLTASAKEKSIDITRAIDEQLPLVKADAEKSTWVLNNFLTNAIKNSSEGSRIIVAAKKENDIVRFSVEDKGPGIPQEYLLRIFERYFKVPGSKTKGTGLGLAISKEFIEAQKGRIWAESEIGKGSVFSFSLPLIQ